MNKAMALFMIYIKSQKIFSYFNLKSYEYRFDPLTPCCTFDTARMLHTALQRYMDCFQCSHCYLPGSFGSSLKPYNSLSHMPACAAAWGYSVADVKGVYFFVIPHAMLAELIQPVTIFMQ